MATNILGKRKKILENTSSYTTAKTQGLTAFDAISCLKVSYDFELIFKLDFNGISMPQKSRINLTLICLRLQQKMPMQKGFY